MTGRAIIERELWNRLERHLPEGVLVEDEPPVIEWAAGGWPPIGETVKFIWSDGETTVTATFAPDDAILLRYQQGRMARMDAWRDRQRGVVFDWMHLDADQN